MSANSKSVISCSIQDRSKVVAKYSNRQRGHFFDSLSRTGSCESGISKAGQSSSQLSLNSKLQQELLHLSQVPSSERLSLEPQKDVCHAELRRVIKAAFDTAAEVSSFGNVQEKSLASLGPEELKRVKASVSNDCAKARERGKFLDEAIAKLGNFRCNVSSRKQIQSEITRRKNRNSSLVNYWSAGGAVLQKSESPFLENQANSRFVDLVSHRPGKRNKTLVNNKQVCTSVVEGHLNVNFPRAFGKSDQEIDVLKPGSPCLSQVEENDCALLPDKGILENMRMKRKRSRVKTDISLPSKVNEALDGKCEHKLSLKDKLNSDSQARRNEAHGYRSAIRNKNRAAEIRTSSAPVTQWLGKRSNKNACIARRINSVSPTSNRIHDISFAEGSACAAGKGAKSDSHGILGLGQLSKCHRGPRNKSKNENLNNSTGLVASKDVESKKEKMEITKNNASAEVKLKSAGSSFGKLILTTKKTEFAPKEGSGDCAHRLVRSRRDSLAGLTSVCQASDTMDITSNTKQLRNLGSLSDKVKSKPSRFLIEKSLSDYNPLTQSRCPVNRRSSDLTGGMDDDYKELLAAVEDANNARSLACAKPFWKEMEPHFRVVTQDDLDYLKQQVKFACDETQGHPSRNFSSDWKSLSSTDVEDNDTSFINNQGDMQDTRSSPGIDGIWLDKLTPLSQRLLSALIVVDEDEQVTRIGNDNGHKNFNDTYEVSPHKNHVEKYSEDKVSSREESEKAEQLQMHNNERLDISHDSTSLNGYINYLSEVYIHSDKNGAEHDILEGSDIGNSKADSGNLKERHIIGSQRNQFGFQSSHQANCVASDIAMHEIEYQQMSLDDKILLELHSIGLFLESVPDLESEDDDSIEEEINKLRKELREKVCKTEAQIIHLEKAVSESWKLEERERECLALNKLILRASKRYLGPRGRGFHRRTAAKKVEQQANLDFVKRTLHKCKKFDETGRSCFNETSLKDKFFPIPSIETTTKSLENAIEGKISHAIQNGGDTESPSDMKPSDDLVVASQSSVRHVVQTHKKDKGGNLQSDPCQASSSLEQTGMNALLEDVVGSSALWEAPVSTSSLLEGAKEKSCETEREGKGQNKERITSLNSTSSLIEGAKEKSCETEREGKGQNKERITSLNNVKDGLQGFNNVNGKRKSITKPNRRSTQLLESNGLLGKSTGELSKSSTTLINLEENSRNKIVKEKNEFNMGSVLVVAQDLECKPLVIDLSHVELPVVDYVGKFDVYENGQNFESFFENDALQDAAADSVGLDVPAEEPSVITK